MTRLMTFAEIGEGDRIDVREGERIFNVEIAWVHREQTTGTLTLTCKVLYEIPPWIVQVRTTEKKQPW